MLAVSPSAQGQTPDDVPLTAAESPDESAFAQNINMPLERSGEEEQSGEEAVTGMSVADGNVIAEDESRSIEIIETSPTAGPSTGQGTSTGRPTREIPTGRPAARTEQSFQPSQSSQPAVRNQRTTPAEAVRFSFRNAPWRDVIEWFADQAALSLQADRMPTGTLNLTDITPHTPTEALDILNAYLQFRDYSLVRRGNTLFVLYLPDGIPANLLETLTADQLDSRGKYEICRVVFQLNRTTPDIVQTEIERLLGPQGNIILMPRSQQIVITETGGTLRAIRDIIQRIDDAGFGTVQMVELRNLQGEEALQIMRTLLAVDASDTSLRTAVDSTGKRILLSGRSDMIERAREVITRVDLSFGSDDIFQTGEPQFDTYDVGFADPQTVFFVLQTLLAGTPDVRLSLDPRTHGILLRARPSVHATVREAIKQMQLNAPQIDIIPLVRMSPVTAVETIRRFYATSSPQTATTTGRGEGNRQQAASSNTIQPPTVEPDTTARQIIVRGTLSQITEIRTLLKRLGEEGTVVASSRATVRAIPLSPTATSLVLEQLQTMLPALEPNVQVHVTAPNTTAPASELPVPDAVDDKTIDEMIDAIFETDLPGMEYLLEHTPRFLPDRTLQDRASPDRTVAGLTRLDSIARQPILAQIADSQTARQPVNITVTPGGIMLSSDDPDALAKVEELIRMLSDEAVLGKLELREYYLTHSSASVVSSELQNLLGTTTSGVGASGVASVDLPDWQQSELMGLFAHHSGNAIEKTGTVTVSANERLNSLWIQANPVDHKTIERLLKILDQPSRDDIMIRPVPRTIQLVNMRASDAQVLVERVFANRSGGQAGRQSGNQPQGRVGQGMGGQGMPGGAEGMQAMLEAMQQMQQMQQGRGGGGTSREQEPPMTLAVDTMTNSLIVSSTESLFLEVAEFVRSVDEAAGQQQTVISTQKLLHVTPTVLQQSLANMIGPSATINRSAQGGLSGFGGGAGGFGGQQRQAGGTFGGGTGGDTPFNPFLNMMGGARPPTTFGVGQTGGGTFGAGTIGGAGARPQGAFGAGQFGGGTFGTGAGGARPAGIGGGTGGARPAGGR